jgi:nanoRNase/pAp phosphatase (c-di-AMP/oligoRNAs hydrolase)
MISQEQQIFSQIEKAQNILITFGADWDGDAIASALALSLYLQKIGKNVGIAADKYGASEKTSLGFLPSYATIKNALENVAKFIVSVNIANAKVDQIKYVINDNILDFIISPKSGWFSKDDVSSATSGYRYDLIIVLNSPDLESLGRIFDNNVDFFYKTTVINIDNTPHNENFGQINFVELNAVAVSELLFEFFKDYKPTLIDADIATC